MLWMYHPQRVKFTRAGDHRRLHSEGETQMRLWEIRELISGREKWRNKGQVIQKQIQGKSEAATMPSEDSTC